MKIGDTVTIYEDPITEKIVESKATLLAKTDTPNLDLEDGSHLEFWLVVFHNDEQGYRKIRVKEGE